LSYDGFLSTATAIVVASDVDGRVKNEASELSHKLGHRIAVCDGTADDVEIQAAIDALPSGGGRVVLTEGSYNVASPITLYGKSDVTVEGQGSATNIIAPTSGTFARFLTIGANGSISYRCHLKNIKFTGDTGLTGTSDGIEVGRGGNYAVDCTLENVYIINVKSSAIAVYSDRTHVINCRSISNGVDLYTSSADDVVIWGGVYKDTHAYDSGEISYFNGGNRVKVIGTHFEQTTNNGEAIDWRVVDGMLLGVTVTLGASSGNNGVIINAATTSGVWVGGRVEHAGYTGTPGAGIQCNAPDWVFSGITFKWDADTYAVLLQNSATRTRISDCICLSGAWFVRAYDIAGDISIINCHANSSSVTDAIRIDAATVNFTGLRVIGGSYTGLGGHALRYVESGGKTIGDVYVAYTDFSGNTGGTITGTPTGTNIKYRMIEGYITENSGTDSIASGQTTKAVTHGLAATPTRINITFAEQGTNDYGRWWISSAGASTFTVNVSADPGASNLDFWWEARVN